MPSSQQDSYALETLLDMQLICDFYVNLLSMAIPRNFVSSVIGIVWPSIEISHSVKTGVYPLAGWWHDHTVSFGHIQW